MSTNIQILRELYQIGERMCAALEDGDVDRFCTLVHERGVLLNGLPPALLSAPGGGEEQQLAAKLREQHQALQALTARYESHTEETLQAITRYKGAQKSYTGHGARPGFLNDQLRG